jgi:hypothetical protein
MKFSDVTTLVALLGVLTLVGVDKLDTEVFVALLSGVLLKNPLQRTPHDIETGDHPGA